MFPLSTAIFPIIASVELRKNILTNVKIEFDGNLRIDKDAEYFSKQQIYQHFKKQATDGIYVYSFSLNPQSQDGLSNESNAYEDKVQSHPYFHKEHFLWFRFVVV